MSLSVRAWKRSGAGVAMIAGLLRGAITRRISMAVMVPVAGLSLVAIPSAEVTPRFGPASVLASAPAGEEQPQVRAGREELIVLGDLPTFKVHSLGGAEYLPPSGVGGGGGSGGGGGGDPRACDGVSTHTDADFSGGAYVLQAGFAETEVAAATYTLAASAFPVKITTTEVIVAQQNTIVSTTTKWTMLFWQGTPQTGTLVASYSSDGELLPHIQMPIGTAGVNLVFGIDPGDPEQIVITDNGTHQFSIGFRIDDHNAQTGDGCGGSAQIPSNRNAFPTTDVSGLSQPANNWLKGVNCGPFGCPANGGWARFSQLPSFCRPSGDWVLKANWTSVNCQPGIGACCLPNGSCVQLTANDCASQAGQYKGDGIPCVTGTCPAPTGACCFSNNFCLTLSEVDCGGAGGTWVGANTTCNGNQCPTGACCLPMGDCIITTQSNCTGQGGTFKGVATTCASADCPQPTGACCFPNGFCLQLTAADCGGVQDAVWQGPLTTCSDGNGNGQADICEPELCPSDFDESGFVDIEDYTAFVLAFEAGTDDADFDESGFVDIEDFTGFVVAFEAGC
ncbi:MAG: hypothetical protein IT435_07310 [Phycisphaerales bacterium]|nr:hypothetical protein [Phycisphaerales bacterium]